MKKNASSSKKNVPEPPKKPLGTFFRYAADVREQFKKKNPDVAGKELNRLLGAEWNKLSEAQTKKYEDAYKKEKEKYEIEKKAYEEKYGPLTKKKKKDDKEGATSTDDVAKRGRKMTKDKK